MSELFEAPSVPEELLEAMQNEIVALLRAWEDRGVTQAQGVMTLLGNANVIACAMGMTLGEATAFLVQQWVHSGGIR